MIAVLACAMLVILGPFRRGRAPVQESAHAAERVELEAAKEAKYREIREAELDRRAGKLSAEDWRAVDTALRAEAIDLVRRLDALGDDAG